MASFFWGSDVKIPEIKKNLIKFYKKFKEKLDKIKKNLKRSQKNLEKNLVKFTSQILLWTSNINKHVFLNEKN